MTTNTAIHPADLQPILIRNAPRDPKRFMDFVSQQGLEKIKVLGINDPQLVADFESNDYVRVAEARKRLNELIAIFVIEHFDKPAENCTPKPQTAFVVPRLEGALRTKICPWLTNA